MRHLQPLRTKAVYQSSLRDKDTNNPFVAGMPPFLEKEEFDLKMGHRHKLPHDLLQINRIDAKEEIDDLKQNYLPLNQAYQLYEHIYLQMRKYYRQVNPLAAEARRLQNALSMSLKTGAPVEQQTANFFDDLCPTILVSGESGCGKTKTIRKILSLFSPLIQHEEFAGKPFNNEQIHYLSFDMQASRSKKALANNFFKELDRVLGFEASKEFTKGITQVDILLSAMKLAIHKYSVGIIHIDEFQFALNHRKKSNDVFTAAELEALFNQVGVPIILSATQDAIDEFSENAASADSQTTALQTVRRVSSVAHVTFGQWKYGSTFTNEFFDICFPSSIFCEQFQIDRKFKIQFLVYTAGIPDAMVCLAIAFVRNFYDLKVADNTKKISDMYSFLGTVYKVRLKSWHQTLRVLQRKYSFSDGRNQTSKEKEFENDAQEVIRSSKRAARTNKRPNIVASKTERIDEGAEVIDPDSIVADYGKGDCDVL
jgi:ABC-type oligopeptide transport system ATPase subunit